MKPTIITTDPAKMAEIYSKPATQSHAEAVRSIHAQNALQSPFAPLQALQEEQREGYAPARKPLVPTPRTDAATQRINAAQFRGMIVAPIFAATLERELAEKDAKIAEQAAQIVALRMFAGKVRLADWKYLESAQLHEDATAALSTPAPKVVPLGELQQLLKAIRQYAEFHGGCDHHPDDCPHEAEECQIVTALHTALKSLSTKYPQP